MIIRNFLVFTFLTLFLSGCNSGATTTSNAPVSSLNDYFNQMTYTPLGGNPANDANQFVLSLSENVMLASADISFYRSQNCQSENIQKTITLYPKSKGSNLSTYPLVPGYYISNDKLNFNLCILYSGNSGPGCYAEFKDINSIKITHRYLESPSVTELCIEASGAGDFLADYTQSARQCSSGSCQYSRSYYSSISLACSESSVKCADGTCAESAGSCPNKSLCPSGTILCPDNPSKMVTCAANIHQCPQTAECPRDMPVRCDNGSCAVSVAVCPAPTPHNVPVHYHCPAGGWNIYALNCGKDSSCPDQAPIKCPDNSCRESAADCKPFPQCPDHLPHLCSDGSCVAHAAQCKQGKCPVNLPVRCPNGECVSSVASCMSGS